MKGTSGESLLNELSWLDLTVRRKLHKLSLMYRMVLSKLRLICAIYVQISFLTDLVVVSVLLGIFQLTIFR